MATVRNPGARRGESDANRLAGRLKPLVRKVVEARAGRGVFERANKDELVTDALRRVVRTLQKMPDANPEAVVRWHVRKAVTDLWRSRAMQVEQMNLAVQHALAAGPRAGREERQGQGSRDAAVEARAAALLHAHLLDENERRAAGHTSFLAIKGEQARIGRQLMRMTVALMPREEDREMFFHRFVAAGRAPTLQELADRSGLSVATVHNRLNAGLELFEFVAVHFRMLDERILENLAERIENGSTRPLPLEELVRAAANYARMQAELSTAHAEVATDIARHMEWIGANLPPRRKGTPAVLRALVEGASRYVIDKDDAQHDMFAVRGLHDDRKVARQVRLAVRDAMKGSTLT